jgi:L-fucono-1,5-lactonase
MTIIDAHQHFWWHARRPHSWPPSAGTRLDRDFTPEDLLPELRRAGVDGTVLIQSLNDADETGEYLDLANGLPWARGVVGWIALDQAAETQAAIERLRARGKLVGFRHLLRFEAAPDWLQHPEVLQSLALIARAGLVFELVPINPSQYAQMLAIAARLPELRLIVNHLGRPPIPEQGWEPWASFIREAADHANVAIKLSTGVAMIANWRWSTDALRRYADHAIACFGPDRVLAASNWPVILIAGEYQEAWGGITDLVAGLSAAERAAVLGGTAERLYRLAPCST